MSSLTLRLIEEKDWHNALKLIKAKPSRVRKVIDGNPLINLCFESDNVANLILDEYPEVSIIKNTKGELPIHVASICSSSKIISRLIEISPNGLREANLSGALPIHFLCRYTQDISLLKLFIDHYSESVAVIYKYT